MNKTPPASSAQPTRDAIQRGLDWLYAAYNARRYIHPDPLEFVYHYDDRGDREIAALVAACLAFGHVSQIRAKTAEALARLGPPQQALLRLNQTAIATRFRGFRYRFAGEREITELLWGAAQALRRYGSLEACFLAGHDPGASTVVTGLAAFVQQLKVDPAHRNYLLPDPRAGSACKRLHLFLRWMVRRDAVDPGGWTGVRPAQLVAPADVHMHRVSRALGFTQRRQADARTALEITAALRCYAPDDPIRYDFGLTRLGIRDDSGIRRRFQECAAPAAR